MADIEISEQEEDAYGNGSFKDEFFGKVSVSTIMSGATSIGRNEARLMLCQLRAVSLQQVNPNDPGVLMLDGLPLSELETFLESAQGPIIDSLKGGADDSDEEEVVGGGGGGGGEGGGVYGGNTPGGEDEDEKGAFNDPNKRTTLPQLATVLDNFKNAETVNQRSKYRNDFFACFNNLDAVHRLQIPTDVRRMIESALTLTGSSQDTLLQDVQLPQSAVERMSVGGPSGGGGLGYGAMPVNMTPGDTGGTTSGYYGEAGLAAASNTIGTSQARKLAELESKNIMEWLKKNKGSSHVWFFVVGLFISTTFFVQVWIDFSQGEMWRAVLMELLTLVGVLICVMEADTPFIRSNIQSRLYRYYQFLSQIQGRTVFYVFVSFCAFGQFTVFDILALVGGSSLMLLTIVRACLYSFSYRRLDNLVEQVVDSTGARDLFDEHDVDQDGYLKLPDLEPMMGRICLFTRFLHEVIFWRMDAATNDGQIDVHEFVQFCTRYKKQLDRRRMLKADVQTKELKKQTEQQIDLGLGIKPQGDVQQVASRSEMANPNEYGADEVR